MRLSTLHGYQGFMYADHFVYCGRHINWTKLPRAETVVNLRNYPSLAGLSYGEVRRGFPEVLDICSPSRIFVLDALNFSLFPLKQCCILFWFFEVFLVYTCRHFDSGIMGMQAVVCGLIPSGGGPEFHPRDTRLLESTDQVVIYILELLCLVEHVCSLWRIVAAKRSVYNCKLILHCSEINFAFYLYPQSRLPVQN